MGDRCSYPAPRYGLMGDHEVVEVAGLFEGARYERFQRCLAGVAVDFDAEAERLVDLAS